MCWRTLGLWASTTGSRSRGICMYIVTHSALCNCCRRRRRQRRRGSSSSRPHLVFHFALFVAPCQIQRCSRQSSCSPLPSLPTPPKTPYAAPPRCFSADLPRSAENSTPCSSPCPPRPPRPTSPSPSSAPSSTSALQSSRTSRTRPSMRSSTCAKTTMKKFALSVSRPSDLQRGPIRGG